MLRSLSVAVPAAAPRRLASPEPRYIDCLERHSPTVRRRHSAAPLLLPLQDLDPDALIGIHNVHCRWGTSWKADCGVAVTQPDLHGRLRLNTPTGARPYPRPPSAAWPAARGGT